MTVLKQLILILGCDRWGKLYFYQARIPSSQLYSNHCIFFEVNMKTATDLIRVAPDITNKIPPAAILRKSLVFHSMDWATRVTLERLWMRSRQICFGPWRDLFERDFEEFVNIEIPR